MPEVWNNSSLLFIMWSTPALLPEIQVQYNLLRSSADWPWASYIMSLNFFFFFWSKIFQLRLLSESQTEQKKNNIWDYFLILPSMRSYLIILNRAFNSLNVFIWPWLWKANEDLKVISTLHILPLFFSLVENNDLILQAKVNAVN